MGLYPSDPSVFHLPSPLMLNLMPREASEGTLRQVCGKEEMGNFHPPP